MAELRYGADRSSHQRANHQRIDALVAEIETLPFTLEDGSVYGRVRASLEVKGRSIGQNDMFIAAHALSRRLILVTDNVDEFRRVKDLTIQNWRKVGPGRRVSRRESS